MESNKKSARSLSNVAPKLKSIKAEPREQTLLSLPVFIALSAGDTFAGLSRSFISRVSIFHKKRKTTNEAT
jgi:hypothetical protein